MTTPQLRNDETRSISPRQAVLNADFFLFCLALVIVVFSIYRVSLNTIGESRLAWSSWAYSDWLISYSAGFVRRGLAGTIMLANWSPDRFLPNLNLFLFLQFVAFVILLIVLFLMSVGFKRALLLIVALPGGLFAMGWTMDFVTRKEMLFNLCLVTIACILCASSSRLARGRAWATALSLTTGAFLILPLVHEGFTFLGAIPFISVLLMTIPDKLARFAPRIATTLGIIALAQFVLASWFKGDAAVAQQMWSNLPTRLISAIPAELASTAKPYGAIDGIGWSLRKGLSLPFSIFSTGMFWYWLIPASVAVGGLVVFLEELGIRFVPEGISRIGLVIGTIFVGAMPMYLLGWDWGRWLSSSTISAVICILVFARYNVITKQSRRQMLSTALFFLVFVVSLTLRMPECCIQVGTTSIAIDTR